MAVADKASVIKDIKGLLPQTDNLAKDQHSSKIFDINKQSWQFNPNASNMFAQPEEECISL